MHVQAFVHPLPHRNALIAGAAGLAGAAAIAVGVVATTDGGSHEAVVAPAKPAAVQSAPDRIWDGSPLLRGTAQSAPERVWDGSPILRGTAGAQGVAAPQAADQRVWDGSPLLRGTQP
jgi:hypothetical protein